MAAAAVSAAGLLTGFGTGDNRTEKTLKTDDVQYNFGPISYDLTNLPPMKNKLYAVWEGRIYYRQYSDEDMEEGGLWGDFSPIAGTEKELMCMERDGSVTQVGVDYGYDGMYIVEGRIYSQKWKRQGKRECVRSVCLARSRRISFRGRDLQRMMNRGCTCIKTPQIP